MKPPARSLDLNSLCDPLSLKASGSADVSFLWEEKWASLAPLGTTVFLESAGETTETGRWCFLAGHPRAEIWGRGGRIEGTSPGMIQDIPDDLDSFLDFIAGRKNVSTSFPNFLAQAWFGAFSYESGVPGFRATDEKPEFYFFRPGKIWALDRLMSQWMEWGSGPETFSTPIGSFRVEDFRAERKPEDYGRWVERAKDYIAQGDIYQANLAQKFTAHWEGDPFSLYQTLRQFNPGPFMGILKTPLFTLVSSSPERLIRGEAGILETRPIAGTRPRGKEQAEDSRLKRELQSHPKELAEHLMLVDLARNDLGRVARYGSVEVKNFAQVESYARVHHLVSRVEARASDGASFSKIFRSVFPGGTITGCPKIRCMQIIQELEQEPRHFYTGSLGYVAPGLVFDFNILIRSFTLWPDGGLEFSAGAGIVSDSEPDREYMETLHKAEALARTLGTSLVPA
ncbi:MAG: anthranilate synthase component I family protein [bacterium]